VYTYAFDNRLTNIQYLNDGGATPDVTWQWDQRYPRVTSLVDGVGGTTTYAYGAIGTPAANLLATENLAGANKIITYTYDAVGRLFSRSIDSANSIQYFRDEIGRIKGTITTSGSVGYFYSATDGRLTSVINPVSGQTLNIGYQDTDPIKPPNLRELLVASGSTALAQLDYASINAMGRIGKITSSVSTVWSNTFTYDNADQLTRANTTGTVAPADNRYTYDLAANVEEWRQIISGSSTYFPYTKDDTNFTTAIRRGTTSGTGTPYLTFTKDANGNTTSWSDAISGKSETLTWDAENRLISVAQSPANKQFVMTYDGRNRLIILEEKLSGVSQKKTWLVWSGMELCEERDGNTNAVLTKYFPEGEMQFTAGSWVTLWYFRDNLGSILETYTSATSRQSQRKFDEWGRIAGSAPGPGVSKKGYTGHYQPEGLEYLMAPYRWYSPTTRSWLSRDPIGEAGGVNLYGYVANNPINSTDNLGLAGAGVNVGAGAQVVVVGGAASAGIGAFSDGKSANVGLYGAAVASIPGETGISIGAGVATPGVGIFFSPTANRAEDLNNLTNTAYIFGGWGPGGSLSVSWGGGQFLFECSFPRLPSFGTWGGGLGVGSGPTSGGTLFGK
jgi:RHS repeat-associated protein